MSPAIWVLIYIFLGRPSSSLELYYSSEENCREAQVSAQNAIVPKWELDTAEFISVCLPENLRPD